MGKNMTDKQKVDALSELLGEVIHRLSMKAYEIEDPYVSHMCDVEADEFNEKMLKILYPDATSQTGTLTTDN
jgi:type VI protein secretion system component VasA